MREIAATSDVRTITLPQVKGDGLRVLFALTHQSKNLYNTALFLIRQVFTAYEYDLEHKLSRIKPALLQSQLDAIEAYNACIEQINKKRTAKYPAQCEKLRLEGKDIPDLKLLPALEETNTSLASILLDATTLDNVLRSWKDQKGEVVYKRMPAVMAQQVLKKLRENFSSFFKASARYAKAPEAFTGRPQMPDYLDKHGRFELDLPYVSAKNGFPSIDGKRIPEDYQETSHLTPELLAAFNNIDLDDAINDACKRRRWSNYSVQHIRIIPLRVGVKLEAVVRIENPYPGYSFLGKLTAKYSKELAECKKEKARDAWLLEHLANLSVTAMPRIASMDLGVNNLVAVAYSTGHRAEVHSGGRFDVVMAEFTDKIAQRISSITPDRVKELQRLKEEAKKNKQRFDKALHMELKRGLKAIYEDKEYRRLIEKKKRWTHDYLHKLSHILIEHARDKKIDVIIVGKNLGWKQEVNHGKLQNRRFCQIAHVTLIQLLKYKAEAAGIAFITTEESYTSKTSFVNGDELESYEDTEKLKETSESYVPAVKTGKRSSNDRHRFVHKNREDRWKIVHADVNGAFNIMRKVFKAFAYHAGLTLKYTLYRLSPRLGVVPINSLAAENLG